MKTFQEAIDSSALKAAAVAFFLAFSVPGFSESAVAYGAAAAAADRDLTLPEMLRYAVEDEYAARAEYQAVLAAFGNRKPFSNIVKSEETHLGWLRDAYAAAKLPFPPDEARTVVPATFQEALSIGVAAEIANIGMYDSFLRSPLLADRGNEGTRNLFQRLRDASKNHLAAFKRGGGD